MDRDHLTRLIDDPARVKREDITDLKTMAERYPWFSGAHLLLAVGGHREGDVLFDEQLRVSAAHLPSRAVLFDMIQAPVATPMAPMLSVVPVEVEQPVEAPAETTAVLSPAPAELPPEPAVPPEPASAAAEPAVDPFDMQIRAAAAATTYDLLLEHTAAPVAPASSEPLVPQVPAAQAPALLPSSRKLSFSAWLELAGASSPATTPSEVSLDQLAPDAQGWLRNMAGGNAPVEPSSPDKPEAKALIDLFVQQNRTGPATKKAEFYSPQLAAKRSLEDHVDMVTETLARIYEKQGNNDKAMAAYERLALKHPERGDYFRSLAKALEGG